MITGASGMLGQALTEAFNAIPEWHVHPCPRSVVDVTDYTAVQTALASYNPHVLIHLAAYTDVEKGENEPDAVYRTNYLGTWYICQSCTMLDVKLIYLSTDLVFSGTKGLPYIETDLPAPLNIYGRSKLAGEKLIRALVRHHYIIRTGWMFGGSKNDHKFVGKVIAQAFTGNPLYVVTDRIGSPVYTGDLAEKIRDMLAYGLPWGTYHVVNTGLCSRYEFASQILRYAGITGVPVHPVITASGAPRPFISALRNYALELMGYNDMRPWQESLEEYVLQMLRERGKD